MLDNFEIIDFHTHAFADEIAARALQKLTENCPIPYYTDGTVSGLLKSMQKAGICKSVICSIATKPAQFKPILDWSLKIRTEKIVPLASVHPKDENFKEHIKQTAQAGIKGIKLHPFYQDFNIDSDEMMPIYEQICKNDLFMTMHTGYDIAFEKIDKASPKRVLNVVEKFPELKFVTTHFGAWKMWDDVVELLIGKNIYIETSFAFDYLPTEKIKKMFERHPEDFILFGTDSPWNDQKKTLEQLLDLNLEEEKLRKILAGNAKKLLGIC